jgi:hypothetical protein
MHVPGTGNCRANSMFPQKEFGSCKPTRYGNYVPGTVPNYRSCQEDERERRIFFLKEPGPGADGVNKYIRSDESGGISHCGDETLWELLRSFFRIRLFMNQDLKVIHSTLSCKKNTQNFVTEIFRKHSQR